ncbi:hypothetical protein LPY66_08275 [Dehalobacter sp. DCM]|uniref:hypothetical protein n=1 Tax=Dehalobacter sp. DCM TaxID=2907827 RepID=UPI003081C3BB|nr:hypothetical protein LPY66_08275 [Dehalobacter sp. DCM]
MSNNLFSKKQYDFTLINQRRINHTALSYPIYSPYITHPSFYKPYSYSGYRSGADTGYRLNTYPGAISPSYFSGIPLNSSKPIPVIPAQPQKLGPAVLTATLPLPVTQGASAWPVSPLSLDSSGHSNYSVEKILIAILLLVSLDLLFVRPTKKAN